jgi:hypothetical protein
MPSAPPESRFFRRARAAHRPRVSTSPAGVLSGPRSPKEVFLLLHNTVPSGTGAAFVRAPPGKQLSGRTPLFPSDNKQYGYAADMRQNACGWRTDPNAVPRHTTASLSQAPGTRVGHKHSVWRGRGLNPRFCATQSEPGCSRTICPAGQPGLTGICRGDTVKASKLTHWRRASGQSRQANPGASDGAASRQRCDGRSLAREAP